MARQEARTGPPPPPRTLPSLHQCWPSLPLPRFRYRRGPGPPKTTSAQCTQTESSSPATYNTLPRRRVPAATRAKPSASPAYSEGSLATTDVSPSPASDASTKDLEISLRVNADTDSVHTPSEHSSEVSGSDDLVLGRRGGRRWDLRVGHLGLEEGGSEVTLAVLRRSRVRSARDRLGRSSTSCGRCGVAGRAGMRACGCVSRSPSTTELSDADDFGIVARDGCARLDLTQSPLLGRRMPWVVG
jgi:hypothetical protein